MLHAQDRGAFVLLVRMVIKKVAEWLWKVCPDLEQSTMLHAADDYAFREACGNGHQEVAEWLWKVCPDLEQSTMLHARDDYVFLFGLSEWSFSDSRNGYGVNARLLKSKQCCMLKMIMLFVGLAGMAI